ncbi:MAG: hypothetical protein WKG01_22410 [Kofleriaceae bacterium]
MKSKAASPLVGCWRITEAARWSHDYLDMVRTAHFEFGSDQHGRVEFGCVSADIDYRPTTIDGQPAVEFSWEGFDEEHPICGRGWAALTENGELHAYLYVHNGDESAFFATLMTSRPAPPPQKPMRALPLGTRKQRRRKR